MRAKISPRLLFWAALALLPSPGLFAAADGPQFSQSALLLPVEEGVRQVRLSVRDAVSGEWSVLGAAHLDGEAGYLKMRIPEGSNPADLQVELSRQDPFPVELYQGKTEFVEKTDQPPSSSYFRGDVLFSPTADGAGAEEGTAQPAEVVESDIWRWQGKTLYFFNQMRGLQVFDLTDPTQPEKTGQLRMPASGEQLYVLNDGTAVLLVSRWYGEGSEVVIVRQEGETLEPVARLPIAGPIVESRMIGTDLYVVSQRVDEDETTTPEGNVIYRWRTGLEIASMDLSDASAPRLHDSLYLTGDDYNYYNGAVQATSEALFVATTHHDSTGLHSRVHYINLTDRQAPLAVQNVIRTSGYLKDKFKLHFSGGILTCVSEAETWTRRHTAVETFDLGGQQSGSGSPPPRLDSLQLATGETLFATRFDGDRVYIVTFLLIDPLFVVDLSNPASLRLLGELEIPGWSTYLEPLGDSLLSVGVEDSRVAVSLFDVADPAHMELSERVYLGAGYSWSEANYDEKAVGFVRDAGLLLVPFQSYEDGAYESKVQILELTDGGLVQRGVLDHAFQARRATLVDDVLVSVSGTELLSFDGSDLDNPALLNRLTIAWPVDRVFVHSPYLIQVENGNPWEGGGAALRISHKDQPDRALAEIALGDLPVSGAALRGDRLVLGHYEQIETPSGDQPESSSLTGRLHTRVLDVSNPLAPLELGRVTSETEEFLWNLQLEPAWLPEGELLWITKASSWFFGWRGGIEPGLLFAGDAAFWPWSYSQTTELHAIDVASEQPRVLSVSVLQAPSNGDVFAELGEVVVHEHAVYQSRRFTRHIEEEGGVYVSEVLLDLVDYSNPELPVFSRGISLPGQLEHVHTTEAGGLLLFTTAARSPEKEPGQNEIWWYPSDLEVHTSVFDGTQAFLVDDLRVPEGIYRPRTFHAHRLALISAESNGKSPRLRFWEWQDKGALMELDSLNLDIEPFRLETADAYLFASSYQGPVDAFDLLAPQPAATHLRTQTAVLPSYFAHGAKAALDETTAWFPTGQFGVEPVALPLPDSEASPQILALREKSLEWSTLPVHAGLIVPAAAEDFVGALPPGVLWRFQPGREVLTFDQWMTFQFGHDSGPMDDSDGDGLANLVEFGFGTDPRSTLSKAHPSIRIREDAESGTQHCEVTFVRNPFATGIYYQVETSGDLQNWTPVPDGRIPAAEGNADPVFRFDLGNLRAGNPQFLRISVGLGP